MIQNVSFAPPLLAWYREHRRDLPWRRRPTAYRVWISEIMLQQTRVETVIPYYRRFLNRFPSLSALARAEVDEVLPLWSGLGYYRRARSLHAAARVIRERHGGRFPRDLPTLLELPGIGPYTAAAILSLAFHRDHVVLDGNVERVMTRYLAESGDPSRPAVKRVLKEALERQLPSGESSDFNQAMMELGARICTPLSPDCDRCPLATGCRGRREGKPTRYPRKAPREKPQEVHVAVAVVRDPTRPGAILFERHPEQAPEAPPYLRGTWNVPLLELEAGPTEAGAILLGHLESTLASPRPEIVKEHGSLSHSITFRRMRVRIFEVHLRASAESDSRNSRPERTWAEPREALESLGISALSRKVIERVEGSPRKGQSPRRKASP